MQDFDLMPVTYQGINICTRRKARWAVLWDYGNIEWEYRPKTFDFGNGLEFTPDFLLHDIEPYGDLYVEIKETVNSKMLKMINWFTMGDYESRRNSLLEKLDSYQFNTWQYDVPVLTAENIRSLLVVGDMPSEKILRSNVIEWINKEYPIDDPYKGVFFSNRTIKGCRDYHYSKIRLFPYVNMDGKLSIEHDYNFEFPEMFPIEETISAFRYARSYPFRK